MTHVVGQVLSDAARGRFPEPDGAVEVVAPWKPGVAGVVALTGRAYVATTRDARDVLAQGPDDLSDHRRLRHARQVRDDVVVPGDDRGMITFGVGIGGLKEIGVEVPVRARNRGVGRALVADALGLVPAGQPVLGAVAPGNAASLRASSQPGSSRSAPHTWCGLQTVSRSRRHRRSSHHRLSTTVPRTVR